MAMLVLDRVWINLMATGESVAAKSWNRSRQLDLQGEVRTYGSGRRRSVTQVGRRNSMAFTLKRLDELAVKRLEGWLGLEVMYRDFRGQRFVGAFHGLDFKEYLEPTFCDVGLTLHEVSWDEAVPA